MNKVDILIIIYLLPIKNHLGLMLYYIVRYFDFKNYVYAKVRLICTSNKTLLKLDKVILKSSKNYQRFGYFCGEIDWIFFL